MPGCPCPESCLETVSTIIQPNLGPWCQRIAFEEQTIEFHLETSWLCCKGSYHCLALHPTWILFRSSGFHNLLDFDNQKSMGNWVVKNPSDLGWPKTVGSEMAKNRRICRAKNPSDLYRVLKNRWIGVVQIWTPKDLKFFFRRIPFEINKQKKKQKNGSEERNPTDHGGTNCATVQDRSGEKNPSDIGMKTKKLRILIAQIVWQRYVGSLFPLHNLKIFFRRISCTQSVYVRSVGFCFFILNLFKYFVDFFISICLLCLKPDMFWLPRSEKKDAPPSTI